MAILMITRDLISISIRDTIQNLEYMRRFLTLQPFVYFPPSTTSPVYRPLAGIEV